MKVLVDTNILIDQVCRREQFVDYANRLFLLGYKKVIQIYFCPISFVNTVYVGRKYGYTQESLIGSLKAISSFSKFAEHKSSVIIKSLNCGWKDFEDANQYFSAENTKIDCIVTRDKKGFEDTSIPCYQIKDFLNLFD